MEFLKSTEKFTKTFEELSKKPSNSLLISALYKFGRCFGGTISSWRSGVLHAGTEGLLFKLNLLEEEGNELEGEKL